MTGSPLAALTWPGPVEALLAALSGALDGRGPAITVVAADAPERILAAVRPDVPLESEDVAAVVPTSGSTGAPKGVLLTSRALTASAQRTHDRLGGAGQWLLALPPTHIAGLQVLVRSLLAGLAPVLLDMRYGFDAGAFVAATERLDGRRRYTALVPTQLERLLDQGGAAVEAAGSYDAILLGGAAAPRHLLATAEENGVRIVPTYGMTETAGGCVYAGRPLDGVQVRVEADQLVRIAGPTLATGYRLDPALTAKAFRYGWFVTADRGRIDRDGRLMIIGRADDAILTGGLTVDPAEVEAVLGAHPKVAEVAVVGVASPTWGEEVVAAVVPTDQSDPPSLEELRAIARAMLGGPRAPRRLLIVDGLPRLPGGKIDRPAVRDLATH